MSQLEYKDLQSVPYYNRTDDLETEESNTCCICNEPDNSLDEADPGLTQLLIECLELDHDNRVNKPEKVGNSSVCRNCKIPLEEWKFSRDQETKLRIRIQHLKATLTEKIVESSQSDASWLRLPSLKGKSWGDELRKIVCLNYDPIVRAKKCRRAGDDELCSTAVSSWHNDHVAASCPSRSSSPQNAVKNEIPAIPSSSPVQTQTENLKTSFRNKILLQRDISLTPSESYDSGGANEGLLARIPKAECVQGPPQSLMAPALTMDSNCHVAGSGVRPIMNTGANTVGSNHPPQPYVIHSPAPTLQVSSKDYFATGEFVSCSLPSCVPWKAIGSTFVSHPVVPGPGGMMTKAPGLFPVEDSSYQHLNPPSVQPASSFPAMPNVVAHLSPLPVNESAGLGFVANASGGQLAVINDSVISHTSHTNSIPILPNPHNLQNMVMPTSLRSGGQATEQIQMQETGTMSMPICPSNVTPHLQQILPAVTADPSSSFLASTNFSTETTTHTTARTNAIAVQKKRKEAPGIFTPIPTKRASTQEIPPTTDLSHIYHNIRLDYIDGRFICGECNRHFEGPHAHGHSRQHIRAVHLGFPWQSQPVQDLGDDNYMYGNQIPFRKHGEYFICGACETLISGKKPDSLIIQHISAAHPDLLNDTTLDALSDDDSNSDLIGEMKREIDWETWTDESSPDCDNNYAESVLTQDHFA